MAGRSWRAASSSWASTTACWWSTPQRSTCWAGVTPVSPTATTSRVGSSRPSPRAVRRGSRFGRRWGAKAEFGLEEVVALDRCAAVDRVAPEIADVRGTDGFVRRPVVTRGDHHHRSTAREGVALAVVPRGCGRGCGSRSTAGSGVLSGGRVRPRDALRPSGVGSAVSKSWLVWVRRRHR